MIFVLFSHQVCRYRGCCHRHRWFVSATSEAWPPQGNLYRLYLFRLVSTWVVHGHWGKVLHVQWIVLDFNLSSISTSLFPTRDLWALTSSLCTLVKRALTYHPVYHLHSSRHTNKHTHTQSTHTQTHRHTDRQTDRQTDRNKKTITS